MVASRNQRVLACIAAVSVAMILIAAAALQVYAQSAARDEVLKLQKQFQDNCVAGNADAVGAVLDDDAIYIHGNGVRHNKSELLALIRSGRSLSAFDLKEPKVILFDGGAIVSGLVDVAFKPPTGSTAAPRVAHMFGSAVWIHKGGPWRLLLDQNTTIAQPGTPQTAQ